MKVKLVYSIIIVVSFMLSGCASKEVQLRNKMNQMDDQINKAKYRDIIADIGSPEKVENKDNNIVGTWYKSDIRFKGTTATGKSYDEVYRDWLILTFDKDSLLTKVDTHRETIKK